MQARHQLGNADETISGYYTGHMMRAASGWRIARYRLTVTFSDDDRRLMGIAYRKATGGGIIALALASFLSLVLVAQWLLMMLVARSVNVN